MTGLTAYALPGIVLVSALGAVIICLLMLRYGFTAAHEEDPDEASHRLLVMRFGHALAALCFAGAAVLAVVAVKATGTETARAPIAAAAPAADPAEVAELRDDIRRLEDRLNRELVAIEERLGSAETTGSDKQGRVEPRPEPARRAQPADVAGLPPATRPPQRAPASSRQAPAGPPERRPAPERDEAVAALPAEVATRQLRATVQGVQVEVLTRPAGGQDTFYIIRLTDSADRPLRGAEVTLQGNMADGSMVRAELDPTLEPGVYRGRLIKTTDGPRDLRLRVVQRDRRFELSLAHAVRW